MLRYVRNDETVETSCRTLAVIARLDRAIQYTETAVIESRSRGVLDAPVKPGHDSGDMEALFAIIVEALFTDGTIAHAAATRARKSSFTISVDVLFTASRRPKFTNTFDRSVKTPASACVCCPRNVG